MISESTRLLLGDMIEVERAPNLTLKGVPEPVTAYSVLSIRERENELL